MNNIRVRVPQVKNARIALSVYYSKSEIGNADIKMLFGDMGQERITKLKTLARERMREKNCPSNRCCDYCKKQVAHSVQKNFGMIITGERRDEGGIRSVPRSDNTSLCFTETASGQYRLRPLYYVSDADKAWYKNYYGIRYSDAYEVYGLTRTGCCGCSISAKAVDDLEKIRPYEPNLVKAAWAVFGESYLYRQKYNEYKAKRREEEKKQKSFIEQLSLSEATTE